MSESVVSSPNPNIKPDPRPGVSVSTDPARADAAFGSEEFRSLPMSGRIHSAAQKALTEMHNASAELAEAMTVVQGKGTIEGVGSIKGDWRAVPGGRLRAFSGKESQLVDAAADRFAVVAGRVDSALADLAEVEGSLAEAVVKKLRDPRAETYSSVALASEIRSYVCSVGDQERILFLSKRVEAGDLQSVSAVLSAPEFLSGLNAESRDLVHKLAARKFAVTESAALEGARRATAMVKSAGTVFADRWRKLVADLGPSQRENDAKIARVRGGGAA